MEFSVDGGVSRACSFPHEGVYEKLQLFGAVGVKREPVTSAEHNVDRTSAFAETRVSYLVQPESTVLVWTTVIIKCNQFSTFL